MNAVFFREHRSSFSTRNDEVRSQQVKHSFRQQISMTQRTGRAPHAEALGGQEKFPASHSLIGYSHTTLTSLSTFLKS